MQDLNKTVNLLMIFGGGGRFLRSSPTDIETARVLHVYKEIWEEELNDAYFPSNISIRMVKLVRTIN